MILQSDPAWATVRAGCVTASRIADVLAKSRDGKSWGVTRQNYAAELVAERLTGAPTPERYMSAAILNGQEMEPLARAAYAFYADANVSEAAFVKHGAIEWAGATPDGFVEDSGLVQIKCPIPATHIDTLLRGTIDRAYRLQMDWEMACSGRRWVDFVSFCPRFPEEMQLFVHRIARDEDRISELERAVEGFLAEIEDTIRHLRHACSGAAIALAEQIEAEGAA